ncbi:mitochondrial fusion GTPase protein [Amniculicola lignicola CBS 123094]|uniref:Mitochondrial fusion GTPase protein n=1 Tax=Amniculicola lignicola CBS 123094 TaxID=1392246 RepID=A0A6A5WZE9_9PLEO|nr:mitochondrial fusion GTPase protein [Amniculicola lignicola CBS 123094]
MNHDDSSNASSNPGGSSSSNSHAEEDPFVARDPSRPGYMTVGSGSTSEAAARLVSLLDHDSGYGGSIMGGHIGEDRPHPPASMLPAGSANVDHDRQRSHVLQLRYNQNKNALGRAIQGTVDTLRSFQDMNLKWPAHYPSMQEPKQTPHARTDSRPSLQHTQTSLPDSDPNRSPNRPRAPRRAGTSVGEFGDDAGESSSAAPAPEPKQEPRLVTPQLAQDFSVLKLELRMGGRTQTDLVHSLEKSSIASLLDGQIQQSIRHLFSLKERIEDISSKVLITGDLNAGKSTFCNALLRRKLLPEDQQPCTSIFCEVLHYSMNGSIEEVHAVPIGSTYNRNDESTYTVFGLEDLEKIVSDNDHFTQCKIYVRDVRPVDESLLNNGVVDIALIDAPGLNADSVKTTAIFARQEEIDVVVFVVSAANHFTLSAKDFIFNAAREKAYIFMVVNGYDNIKDKRRCQEMILKQVHHLSPATFKESSELVHFVSSNAIPVDGGGSPPDGDGDDDPSDKGKGKGKEAEKQRDFDELEVSLRRFVLEKRARSKLAPAKTYLMNVLGDVHSLATVNRDVAQSELDRVKKEIDALEPEYEESKKARIEAGEAVDRLVEETTSDVYTYTRDTLTSCITKVGEQDLGVPYPGLLSAYQYAEDLRDSMLHEITESVRLCEENARSQAVGGYNGIKNLGVLHLGNKLYADVMFRPERMFRKPIHALARQVDIDIEIWDFFDIVNLWERQEKVAGTGMAVTVVGMVGGRMMGGVGWLDGALGAAKIMGSNNMRRLIIPGLICGVAIGVSYVLSSIPKSLPHRLSAKLSSQLTSIDYTHSNALRISSEIRRALKGPANDVRIGLQRNVEKLQTKREETTKFKIEAEVARKYFGNLVRSSNDLKQGVQRVDLEAAPPTAMGPAL